ncbi:adenylate/guanylate cyclase domain-containing protein [Sphingomonas jatrophae]|uniref:Adenylate/guanylate cyclase n=1 Tax=Sphingomonas jatrophae TaxID=1166337 RepID=A0A1I6JN04_9SPHN|nr:adenylate/guanylate cyclase domain-containing protein [Sphingomonas jatrophae]SFR80355.1 adenylate/guanylate cyclase [Sphingomonas jatrophae]
MSLPDGREAAIRRTVRQIGPARLALACGVLLLAFAVARAGWSMPLFGDAERLLYDARAFVAAPRVPQDERILLVPYTDETLAATGKRSPVDRAILARALTALDSLGARAIGIDILIDQAQPEDAELIDAFRRMRTPTYLAFATNATSPDYVRPWQEAFLRDFLRRIGNPAVRPAAIRIVPDDDGTMRHWPVPAGGLPPLMADALVGGASEPATRGAIRYRLPADPQRPVFAALPIDLLATPGAAALLRQQVAGRIVLIGGDISDVDRFTVPASRYPDATGRTGATMAGLEVHASLLAQRLDAAWDRPLSGWLLTLAALAIVAAAAATALTGLRPPWSVLLLGGELCLIALLPFVLQYAGVATDRLPAFGWLVGWTIAYAGAAAAARAVTADQRRFAQSALGRYLPRDIADEIMRDPASVSLHGEKREIYALFTDLEGFTKLAHAIPPETVARLLNRYLDLLSETVLKHGGTIDKFVGDAIVAFWGAPLARPDDGERAAQAALAMAHAGERFRREAPEGTPPIGCTRVGLHRGEAIVGNFGGEGRLQYTALGDSMNLAARLEAANKQLSTCALVSGPAVAGVTGTRFRPMGRISVRGRSTPIEVHEPLIDGDDGHVTPLTDLLACFDQGDRNALLQLEALAGTRPDDAALANLVYRLGQVGPGGSFVLQ